MSIHAQRHTAPRPKGRPIATTETSRPVTVAARAPRRGDDRQASHPTGASMAKKGCLIMPARPTSAPAATNADARRRAVGDVRANTTSSTEALAGRRAKSSKLAAWPSAGRKATVPRTTSAPAAKAARRSPVRRTTSTVTTTPVAAMASVSSRRSGRRSSLPVSVCDNE